MLSLATKLIVLVTDIRVDGGMEDAPQPVAEVEAKHSETFAGREALREPEEATAYDRETPIILPAVVSHAETVPEHVVHDAHQEAEASTVSRAYLSAVPPLSVLVLSPRTMPFRRTW